MQPMFYRNNLLSRLCCIALSLVLSFSFLVLSFSYPKRAHAFAPVVVAGGALAGAEFTEVAAAVGAIVAAGSGLAIGAGAMQQYSQDWFTWYGKDSTAEDWTAQDWQNLNAAHLCEVVGIEILNSSGQRPPDDGKEPNEDDKKLAKVVSGVLTVGCANAMNMADAMPGLIDWLSPGDNSAISGLQYPSEVTSSDGSVFLVDSHLDPANYLFTRGLDNSGYSYDVVWLYNTPGSLVMYAFPVDSSFRFFKRSNDYVVETPVRDLYRGYPRSDWRCSTDSYGTSIFPVGHSSGNSSIISPRVAQAIDANFSPEQTINDSLPLLSDPDSVTGYIGDAMSDIVGAVQTAQQYWQNLHNNAGLVPEGATEPAPYKVIQPVDVPITQDVPYSDIVRDSDHDPVPDPGDDPVNPNPNPDPNPDPVPFHSDEFDGAAGDLMSLFPFCLPHDLHVITSRLVATSSAPCFTWVFDFTSLGVGRHELEIDLDDYADIARIIRFMLLVSFLIGWILFLVKTKPWDIGT